MKRFAFTLAVLVTVAFPGLAIAETDQTALAAEGIQLNDAEMDNISAAGLGKANAPGQLMKQQRLLQVQAVCAHGNSCNAPGRIRGASSFAPGRNR